MVFIFWVFFRKCFLTQVKNILLNWHIKFLRFFPFTLKSLFHLDFIYRVRDESNIIFPNIYKLLFPHYLLHNLLPAILSAPNCSTVPVGCLHIFRDPFLDSLFPLLVYCLSLFQYHTVFTSIYQSCYLSEQAPPQPHHTHAPCSYSLKVSWLFVDLCPSTYILEPDW